MSMWKEAAIAVPGLAALLFVSHMFYGSDDREFISTPSSWLGAVTIPPERYIAKDLIAGRASNTDASNLPSLQQPTSQLTPQQRIRGVFAQFSPSGSRSST
jgi:hypothetical protein